MVNAIPEGFTTLTPHIICKDAGAAIEFYKKAFGAEEICRMPGPDGQGVMHAEIQIGNSRLLLVDENPQWEKASPESLGGSPVTLHLYVEDCDKVFQSAVDAGATAAMPPMDTFWGDRYSKAVDPFGHHWGIATHIKDMTPEEIGAAAGEFFKNQ